MNSAPSEMQKIDREYRSDYNVEFEIEKGTCYLWCCWGTVSYGLGFFCCCVARKLMTSQQVIFEDKRLNYKSDCWLMREDKMVPYDRIQDVNITENCIQRCCGVHDVSIQTAGGGQVPEVIIKSPKNPKDLRDQIIAHRDAIVHNQQTSGGGRDDGTGVSSMSPLIPGNKKESEMVEIHQTLLRIETLMQQGLAKV